MKTCGRCHVEKSSTDFYRNKRERDGLTRYCRTCVLAQQAQARLDAGMKPRVPLPRTGRRYDVPEGQKYCPHCKIVKARTEFYPAKSSVDGLFGWCKDCQKSDMERRRRAKGIGPRVVDSERKSCPRCGQHKLLSAFAPNPARPRGVNAYCRPCHRAYMKTAQQRSRRRPRPVEQRRRRLYGKHAIAARMVQGAIQLGILTRQPCETCGTTEHVHAHHDDYMKPLDVRWLCRTHHNHAHGKLTDLP